MNTETIEKLIYTLNQIEVHGQSNLDKLLGCIMLLKSELSNVKEVNTDG